MSRLIPIRRSAPDWSKPGQRDSILLSDLCGVALRSREEWKLTTDTTTYCQIGNVWLTMTSNHTPSGEALTDLILETFKLNGALLDAGNQLTEPYGLTSARWQVMGAIDLAGQAMTVAQIARRMGLARQGVQRIANDLEGIGMVRFADNVDHKRAKLVSLTATGRKTMDQINTAQAAWVNELSSDLGEKKIKQALNLLRSVQTRLRP